MPMSRDLVVDLDAVVQVCAVRNIQRTAVPQLGPDMLGVQRAQFSPARPVDRPDVDAAERGVVWHGEATLVVTCEVQRSRFATVGRRLRTKPELVAVLAVGLAVRLTLIPITRGQDFVVWDLASAATLRGTNVYAHHPNYSGGPYSYFPLFLYIELPFQWLAQHAGLPFTILGKLPMLVADIATSLLIAAELSERRYAPRIVAVGAAVFFLNPLVIYNSAYYGRFDSVGCALLLFAVRRLSRRAPGSGIWYALAVAAKTFPVFVLPAVLRAARRARVRAVFTLAAVIGCLSVPYLATWRPYLHDTVVYDVVKAPQYLSWQRLLLHVTDTDEARRVSYVLLGLFALGAVGLSRRVSLERSIALTFVLFILCSKVVLDQYLIWPLPWLILATWTPPRLIARASAVIVIVFTSVGMLANASIHPWGRSPWWLVIGLAVSCACYLLLALNDSPTPTAPISAEPDPFTITQVPSSAASELGETQ